MANVHATSNVSDRTAEALIDLILSDKLGAGTALPSERQLMDQLGVSRLVCREALAKLRGMGIIRAHHGKGAFVAELKDACANPATLKLLLGYGEISNDDIIRARLIIEPVAAGWATRQANKADRQEILSEAEAGFEGIEEMSVLDRAQKIAQLDVAFHQHIAAASGNPILPMLLKSMHELLLRIRLEVLIVKPDIVAQVCVDHRKIGAAIAGGDTEGAQRAMERHIRLRGRELLGAGKG